MQELPTPWEQQINIEIRRKFCFPAERDFFADLSPSHFREYIRAFRALKDAKRYIEIGTYDKGNLGYLIEILAEDATIIDIDVGQNREQADKLKDALKRCQTYHQIVGDSQAQETAQCATEKLGGLQADAIFIDASHAAEAVITDYSLYSPLVRPGGLVLFHDALWTGDDIYLGVAQALEIIDRITPVYLLSGDRPVHRFVRPLRHGTLWGGFGVIAKEKSN